jgi:uncharacterized membrane protein
MPKPLTDYTPQRLLENQKKQAIKTWIIAGFIVALWVFVIVLAPIAKENGLTNISSPIYGFFSYLCHQMPSRTFHISEYPFAVCSRCFGVYFGLLFGFILYPFIRSIEEIEPFPRIWLFLALIPMGIDWSLGFFNIWENTHISRFITGLILGTACAVFIIPALVELGQLLAHRRQTKRLPN